MLIGYDRVSTKDRCLDLHFYALRKAEGEAVFTEVASGARTARPELDEALSRLQVGGYIGEFERDLIGERTQAGLEAARVRGWKGGRPRRLSKQVGVPSAYDDPYYPMRRVQEDG